MSTASFLTPDLKAVLCNTVHVTHFAYMQFNQHKCDQRVCHRLCNAPFRISVMLYDTNNANSTFKYIMMDFLSVFL